MKIKENEDLKLRLDKSKAMFDELL
jgi:hypothetical protein